MLVREIHAMILLATAFPLAGCMGDSGGAADLSFEGDTTGSHEDATKCNQDGTLNGSGTIESGSVLLRVTDGSGNEVFEETYDQAISFSGETVTGASGTWTIQASRSTEGLIDGEFRGDYKFHLAC